MIRRIQKRRQSLVRTRDIRRRPLCNDLAAWAREREWSCEVLAPARVVERKPSRTIPEQLADWFGESPARKKQLRDPWLRERLSRLHAGELYEVPPVLRVRIPNATVHAPTGTVLLPTGEVAVQSTVNPQVFFDYPFQTDPSQAEQFENPLFLLGTRWGWNYAHWLFDSMPKLFAADSDSIFLLHGDEAPFQTQSLELLGIPASHIVRTKAEWVRVAELTVCVAHRITGIVHPDALDSVRKGLLKAASASHSNGPRLYIHRKDPARSRSQRTLLNEPEIRAVFGEFGFETIIPDELPFAEQVKCFANASAIAGAHGAGNHNNLFVPRGIPVIELYNPLWWDHTVARIASLYDQPHHHLFGENRDKRHRFTIAPPRLRKLLAKALDGADPGPALEVEFH